jgi:hypothetical protein
MSTRRGLSRPDYEAAPLTIEHIARRTAYLRSADRSLNIPYFNIVNFFERIFQSHANNRPIEVILYDAPPERPAFVRHHPPRLSIDRERWKLANDGEPASREILAHELGHLDLHDRIIPSDAYQQSFSTDDHRLINYRGKNYSAEWQADRYADHLLVPDSIALAYDNAHEIAAKCQVPLTLAQRRFGETRSQLKQRCEQETASWCSICGTFISCGHVGAICADCHS